MLQNAKNCVLILILGATLVQAQGIEPSNEEKPFEQLTSQLYQAIEVRNFKEARELIGKILPLMKEQLKTDKKMLSELKKQESPEVSVKDVMLALERKNSLYESLKELVDASPAALRVRATQIQLQVKEFASL